MFPAPKQLVIERAISSELDRAYGALLSQELRFCRKNQATIQRLASVHIKEFLFSKSNGLVVNSCDFKQLEEKCKAYAVALEKAEITDAQNAEGLARISMAN